MPRMSLLRIPIRLDWVINIYKQIRSKGMFPLGDDKFRMNLEPEQGRSSLQTDDHDPVDGGSRGCGESLNSLAAHH